MTKTPSFAGIAGMVVVCAISYGVGTGWIRLGTPQLAARQEASRTDNQGEEEWRNAAEPRVRQSTAPALVDPSFRRAQAILPNPLVLSAIAQDGSKEVTAATLDANKDVADQIKTAVQTAAKNVADGVVRALSGTIDGRAQFTEKYEDTKAEMTKAATDDATTKATPIIELGVKQAAVKAANTTTPKWPDPIAVAAATAAAKADLNPTTVIAPAQAAADAAARAAIDRIFKERYKPRSSFAFSDKPDESDVVFTFFANPSDNTTEKKIERPNVLKFDGPELTIVASVTMSKQSRSDGRKFDDSGSDLKLELVSSTSGTKPYLDIVPDTAQAVAEALKKLSVKAVESGPYDVVVTLTPKDRAPIVLKYPIVMQAATQNVRPAITKVDETQGDRRVHFDLSGSAPVELRTGNLILTATTTLAGQRQIIVNADSDTAVKGRDGQVTTVTGVAGGAEIPVTISPDELTDKPMRLVVVDLWTRQKSDAITVVIPGGSGGLPSETVGIRGTTGINPVFSEYTVPRTIPEGFKPSDKVETRVARLYYYRDAHRVAQIVNRDVKSYNRVAVDTRRRMADKARDEANNATDTRRLEEIRAVRSAQGARAGEAKLRQAQADLSAALQSEQKARQDAPVVDAQLTDADTNIAQRNSQLDALQTQLDQAKALPQDKQDPNEINRLTAAVVEARVRRNQLVANQAALNQQKTDAQSTINGNKSDDLKQAVDRARAELEALRTTEAEVSDQRVRGEQIEDRARENQFRQEVAAAHEDPDTYVPGNPLSPDPVLQVSVSVIGEGLIQLRGPIKGINVIRTMINQIDAPASQVRISIHTVQINGEHGDRMEKVATRIQDYIDHSRFLTAQSAQMLRNAVVKIASDKANQAVALCPNAANHQPNVPCPNDTQQARDARYQEAFFGSDFIIELRAIDSEFLMTGNKLLSLHSMDTTSLASALFLLALAKNDIREEILAEFQRAMQTDLPAAEESYYAAGEVGRAKDLLHHNDFKQFAGNAKFQSLIGFFNAQVAGADTLNPLQREFLKLAQVFKSRLVTELEYNQRVKERGLIEDRIDPIFDRKKARAEEEAARTTLINAFNQIYDQRDQVITSLTESQAEIRRSQAIVDESVRQVDGIFPAVAMNELSDLGTWNEIKNRVDKLPSLQPDQLSVMSGEKVVKFNEVARSIARVGPPSSDETEAVDSLKRQFPDLVNVEKDAINTLFNYMFSKEDHNDLKAAQTSVNELGKITGIPSDSNYKDLLTNALVIRRVARAVQGKIQRIDQFSNDLFNALGTEKPNGRELYGAWLKIKYEVEATLRKGGRFRLSADKQIAKLNVGFGEMLRATLKYESAQRIAELSRHPLDHKRLLDMLIDDVEDKYIELLEGTRSHTANIDAYIKSIATALDDDFNTQYYYPTFTEIRHASRFHDVTLAQIETTNVLANNRGFAKVEPQATMEFDLPKRDILINEAMNGALAMTKDFGALANDPTFLSMAKLRSGQPTSSLAPGAGEGVNTVRNTLPGLSRADDEKLFSQQGAGRAQFGSAMEALIPDPAVYKFETGTGFEIRPVVQPDGQSVVFHFNYMYTTNIREPVRADEKHLGRVKRHFIDTDVQLGNYELREVSRYQVALKVARTSRGIPLFEDIPLLGILFRPLPSAESSLQENIVLGQSTIFPTLFDLMGLRWAPAVADLDTLRLRNDNFVVRGRNRDVQNRVFDISSAQVDEFLQIPPGERRPDLYRTQQTIPDVHPNGYRGPGLNYQDSRLREGYDPIRTNPERGPIPSDSRLANPPASPLDPTQGSSPPRSSATGMPGRRESTPVGVARPGSADRPAVRVPIPGPDGPVRQGLAPAEPMIPPPSPGRGGASTPLIGPTSATPSRTMARPGPGASGASTGVVDNAVSRASFTGAQPAAARRGSTVPPPRRGTPARSSGSAPGSAGMPGGTSAGKVSATPKAPADKSAQPRRLGILSRLRGTTE